MMYFLFLKTLTNTGMLFGFACLLDARQALPNKHETQRIALGLVHEGVRLPCACHALALRQASKLAR